MIIAEYKGLRRQTAKRFNYEVCRLVYPFLHVQIDQCTLYIGSILSLHEQCACGTISQRKSQAFHFHTTRGAAQRDNAVDTA